MTFIIFTNILYTSDWSIIYNLKRFTTFLLYILWDYSILHLKHYIKQKLTLSDVQMQKIFNSSSKTVWIYLYIMKIFISYYQSHWVVLIVHEINVI